VRRAHRATHEERAILGPGRRLGLVLVEVGLVAEQDVAGVDDVLIGLGDVVDALDEGDADAVLYGG
jgi:hypothetical protein